MIEGKDSTKSFINGRFLTLQNKVEGIKNHANIGYTQRCIGKTKLGICIFSFAGDSWASN